jgi:non-ribosomal peptide synthetase component E (peptide arylation enzyme)
MSDDLASQPQVLIAALGLAGDEGLTCAEAALIIHRSNAAASKVLSLLHKRGLAEYAPADDPQYVRSRGSSRGAVHVASARLFGSSPQEPESEK